MKYYHFSNRKKASDTFFRFVLHFVIYFWGNLHIGGDIDLFYMIGEGYCE